MEVAEQPQNIKYKTIRCRTITGVLHSLNKGAIDWGWQSLVAYGCQTVVVVVESKTVQVLQTLSKHRNPVVKVKWAKENYYHDLSNPYYPKLASADSNGTIIVWDVIYSKAVCSFSDGNNKPILDMEWLSFWSSFNDFLAVLHPPYSFVIWNATNGNKLWKKTYTETLLSFSFDPFDPSNVAFLAQDSILFIDDFTLNKVPSSNGRKFYISNSSSVSASVSNAGSETITGSSSTDEKLWKLKRKVRLLVNADTKSLSKSEEVPAANDCLGLAYHKATRHHLLLSYSKEILIVDLEINQTVGIISMDRNGSPFNHIIPCQQWDAIYCLHENGSVSLRCRKRFGNQAASASSCELQSSFLNTQGDNLPESYYEVSYEMRSISDSLRLTKHARLMGMAVCPVTERRATVILSDGRLLFLDLQAQTDKNVCLQDSSIIIISDHFNGDNKHPAKIKVDRIPKVSLPDLFNDAAVNECSVPSSKEEESPSPLYKLLLTGLLINIAPPPFVIRMCPPLTVKNWNNYNPWLAIGTIHGTIQVVCMASGMVQKELSLHTCPVRGIEWSSLHSILTFAYPNIGSGTVLVRNELILTNVLTGKSKFLRLDKGDESPIEMVRVSHHKQYFIVAFKDEPFELWDLQRLLLLRTMPKKFPLVTALEWSPICSIKKKSGSIEKGIEKICDVTPSTEFSPMFPDISLDSRGGFTQQEKALAKEHFVFTDTDGQLYNFSVEGNVIKDGFKIPADGNVGSVTCIAWRSEQIVMGDVDGNLIQWELIAKTSTIIPTQRGWIKKIRFAPGRGNMKILIMFNNGIDIWDLRDIEKVGSLRCPADIPKIHDVDWAASDTAILATVDGCLHLMDLKLKRSTSPTYRYNLQEPVFIPYLSTSEAALNLRTFLQHQGWRSEYSLEFSEKDGIRGDDLTALQNYIASIDSDIGNYLPHCKFGTAQRCLLTSRLFGDESELHFWTVALHYLKLEKKMSTNIVDDDKLKNVVCNAEQDISSSQLSQSTSLDTCYDVLCSSATFKRRQLDRVALLDSKRSTYDQTKKCAESLIMLGQTDRAVQILLETEAENDNYYIDNLRACLVASVCSSGAAQSTIKLVATNLIANGRISEGVQLLCLIGKSADACRYLQSYGHWNRAVWLAKSTLEYADCLDVMKRWVDHLCSTHVNQKQKAILVLLSMGQYTKVLELLLSMKAVERAAMFVHAYNEMAAESKGRLNESLVGAIQLEYARYLFCLGNTPAAYYYCELVGEHGDQLRKEMDILSEDSNQ